MDEFDFYVSPKKPMIGLYVKKGAGLPDLVDAKDWLFDGTVGPSEVPAATVNEIETNGHAFKDLDAG